MLFPLCLGVQDADVFVDCSYCTLHAGLRITRPRNGNSTASLSSDQRLSIQTVPTTQPHVRHTDVVIRTGVWFVQIANKFGQNHESTAEQKKTFRHDTDELVKHAKTPKAK
jgi:hypothetical protein